MNGKGTAIPVQHEAELTSRQRFAKNLRFLRLRRSPRLSQDLIANKLGVTRATYANYESGRVAAPMWFVCAASSYFGVSVNDLVFKNLVREDG